MHIEKRTANMMRKKKNAGGGRDLYAGAYTPDDTDGLSSNVDDTDDDMMDELTSSTST